MAPALFYLKGVAPPQIRFGAHIIRGVIPFLLIQALALVLLAVWPGVALWLPSMMLR
jgi:TRAP-type mannitol/chloroaromatic compound transport system permease large subunit